MESARDKRESEENQYAILVMQPSLHTVDEFNRDAICQMADLEPNNKAIQKLYKEYDELPNGTSGTYSWNMDTDEDSEALNEICDDMMQALEHDYTFDDDTFIIWGDRDKDCIV